MSRDVRLTLDDHQFQRLNSMKDRYGYTWKGLMLEGVKRIDAGSAVSFDRDRLQERIDDLRERFGDRDHYTSIRLSTVVDEQTGSEPLGIRVKLMDNDLTTLWTDLEDIDRALYQDGYNTAWACECPRPADEATTPEGEYLYTGKTTALLLEHGMPQLPTVPELYGKADTNQNSH